MKNALRLQKVALLLLLQIFFIGELSMPQIKTENNNKIDTANITVIYDNNPFLKGLQTDWGFACLVEVGKTKLLFDTGDNGDILLSNMEKLKIDPQSIDLVFLSHFHHDHTGGLSAFLKKNSNVTIYYPNSFPAQLVEEIKKSGAKPIPISSFQEIQTNLFSLGELGNAIPEQSLAIRTTKGIVVITGCAHPGIVNILEKAKNSFPDELIYLALGGFHLHNQNEKDISKKVNEIMKMEIISVGPCHCSGDLARNIFKEVYKENFIELGVGKVINID
ncbi:MAG: MBL fold metallo-hydrolase [Ignavibacteriaceae bacterium]|jgi:7,8-dihydropterin-6-yl-methyl-4-(beta-D-ribofuranosyl)aminobenzene 5'-phosphate synthase|nr:MBL fold metallo-hydrolase [Ignavibacteriaceae bacterium]MCW9096474.1 MBL fold metallo-hydrolase [Ignavibacteriaceae bacterium]